MGTCLQSTKIKELLYIMFLGNNLVLKLVSYSACSETEVVEVQVEYSPVCIASLALHDLTMASMPIEQQQNIVVSTDKVR